MTELKIFDAGHKYDGPARDTESSFHFLNRAAGTQWQKIRDQIEHWYTYYPDPDGDLRARFRSDDGRQQLPAWWELYVHTLFRHLGFDVEVHPTVPNSNNKPDFRVSNKGATGIYVECAALIAEDGVEHPAGQAWICECINRAKSPDFMVDVDIVNTGTDQPTMNEVVRPIEQWLNTLDYACLSALFDTTADVAGQVFEFRDWKVHIAALPVNEDSRGRNGRLIAFYPSNTALAAFDGQGKIRKVLRNKGSHYGDLDEPLVVAILGISGFVEEYDMTNAVFGSIAATYRENDLESAKLIRQRDGYWRPPPSTRGSRVAGVLFAEQQLKPWSATSVLPELWLNPWAPMPVQSILPFTIRTADDIGNIRSTPARTTPQQVFGLT